MAKSKKFNVVKLESLLNSAGNVKNITNMIIRSKGDMTFKISNVDKVKNPFEREITLEVYTNGIKVDTMFFTLGDKYIKEFGEILSQNSSSIAYYKLMALLENINSVIRGHLWDLINCIPNDNSIDDIVNSFIKEVKPGTIADTDFGYIVKEEDVDPYGEDAPIVDNDENEECLELETEPEEGELGFDPGIYLLESRLSGKAIQSFGFQTSPQAARNAARAEGYGFPGLWRVVKY